MFYIVSTPIGNLEDMTLRSIRVLKEVDLIACEDTRKTSILLNKYEIKTKTISYHAHSKDKKSNYLVDLLKSGKNIALVSDAGTPGVSDPGVRLIAEIRENNIPISVIPGASAFLSALSLSGFALDEFTFLGFPPNKSKRLKFFEKINQISTTVVFYESSHRILKCLTEIEKVIKEDRKICVCRELTKMFEESIILEKKDIENYVKTHKPKGEYVVVIA